jgi:hypothetical protein
MIDGRIRPLLTRIESQSLAAQVAVVGGLRPFVRALRATEPVRALSAAVRDEKDLAWQVLGRLIELTRLRIDARYENPNDVAMAAYVMVLSAAPSLFAMAVDAVLSAQNVWWATQLVRASQTEEGTGSGEETVVVQSTTAERGGFELSAVGFDVSLSCGFFGELTSRFWDGWTASPSVQSGQGLVNVGEAAADTASSADSQYALAA